MIQAWKKWELKKTDYKFPSHSLVADGDKGEGYAEGDKDSGVAKEGGRGGLKSPFGPPTERGPKCRSQFFLRIKQCSN